MSVKYVSCLAVLILSSLSALPQSTLLHNGRLSRLKNSICTNNKHLSLSINHFENITIWWIQRSHSDLVYQKIWFFGKILGTEWIIRIKEESNLNVLMWLRSMLHHFVVHHMEMEQRMSKGHELSIFCAVSARASIVCNFHVFRAQNHTKMNNFIVLSDNATFDAIMVFIVFRKDRLFGDLWLSGTRSLDIFTWTMEGTLFAWREILFLSKDSR